MGLESLARIAAQLAAPDRPTLVTNPVTLMASWNSVISFASRQKKYARGPHLNQGKRFAAQVLLLPPKPILSTDQHLRNLVHTFLQGPGRAPTHREALLIG